jgi:hypothetical protein
VFERFTDRARRVLVIAQEEARILNHSFIGTEHILLGLTAEGDGLAAMALGSLGISTESLRARVEEMVSSPSEPALTSSPPFTPRAKKVLELSLREALQLGHNYIGTEHLLLGLIREGEGVGAHILENLGADLPRVRAAVTSLLAADPGSATAALEPKSSPSRAGTRVDMALHPTRVLPGPPAHLESESLVFRIVGVLVFPEGVRVHWRISGIPKPLTGLMETTSAFSGSIGPQQSFPELSDDAGTFYRSERVTVAPQPESELAGVSFFTPTAPSVVAGLRLHWLDQIIEVPIPPEP